MTLYYLCLYNCEELSFSYYEKRNDILIEDFKKIFICEKIDDNNYKITAKVYNEHDYEKLDVNDIIKITNKPFIQAEFHYFNKDIEKPCLYDIIIKEYAITILHSYDINYDIHNLQDKLIKFQCYNKNNIEYNELINTIEKLFTKMI